MGGGSTGFGLKTTEQNPDITQKIDVVTNGGLAKKRTRNGFVLNFENEKDWIGHSEVGHSEGNWGLTKRGALHSKR